ncbi:MAG: SpaH/EbpB family LPXTG-anchored major pilin [Gemmiger sp.]
MKKKSRFLTGLLSAVMALSLFALPVAADNAATTAKPVAIDKNATGSIEIHKYIYNGEWNDLTPGTGEAESVTGEDKTPLKGVTFTAYQVMTADQLEQYYNGLTNGSAKEAKIEDYVKNGDTFITEKSTEKEKNGTPKKHEATTDENGTGTIDALPVGLYAVLETAHPDSVTQTTPAFLVSIPMTQRSTGDNWMYNVVVYPKNKTTVAEITLKKQGKTGDTNDGALTGYKFKLEKYITAENVWKVIKGGSVDGQDSIGVDGDVIGTTDNGVIKINGLTPGIYRFTEVEGPANSAYIIDKDSHYYFEVAKDGKIAKVKDSDIQGDDKAVLDAVGVNSTITVTNHKPDLEKNVQNGEKKEADYSAGDMVPYQITIKVPENIAKLKTFTVTDTPNGLNDDTATIKVVGKTSSADVVLAENGVIDTINGNAITKIQPDSSTKGFTIEFAPANLADYAGQELVITYKAKLLGKENNNAAVANQNNAKLTYSNVIDTTEGAAPSEKTIEDETVVYSFKLTIDKQGDKPSTKLEGVEFDLYKVVDETETNKITDEEAGKLGLDTSKNWQKVNAQKIITDSKGAATLTGLANGTYYLVETKTVEGYNLLSKPVEVTLNKEYNSQWTEKTEYDANGNVKHYTYEKDATKFDGGEGTKSSVQSVTVINRMGFKLPTTGGFGTLLFSGIGALLVVGGVGVLMSTKKKKKGNA